MENTQVKPYAVNFSADLIRVLAILLIIFVHADSAPYTLTGGLAPASIAGWWTIDVYRSVGNFGVPLFIMLTGVLLLNPAKCDESMSVFFKKRWARIGIPMIFWTAFYFAWGYYVHGYALTTTSIWHGLLSGSYYQLGFIYILIGLYLATPILRPLIKNIDKSRLLYFLVLWVIGSFAVPFIQIFLNFNYNPVLFVFSGWIGYFLLGVYLLKTKVRSWVPFLVLTLGVFGAVLGDWAVTLYDPIYNGFFHEYLIFTTIAASAALFLLLLRVPSNRFVGNIKFNRVLKWVSQNTLTIFFFHVIVLELIGTYLGYIIWMFTMNYIIEVPVLTALTFAGTCLILYPLLKIPYFNKIIGGTFAHGET